MAAVTAKKNGANVLIIEKKSKICRKLLITGKGRCNITNNCSEQEFISSVTTNGKFMYSAIRSFSPLDTIEFFEENGLKLKTERGNRVFPTSDKAMDVVDLFYNLLRRYKIKVIHSAVEDIFLNDDNKIDYVVVENGATYKAHNFIIATGGVSYPLTGSSGDGYKFAKKLGHTIVEPRPSLSALVTNGDFCKSLQGLALKNISIKVIDNGKNKEIYSDFGELLFTHFGVSGPVILSASSHLKNMSNNRYSILLDLKPALSLEQLENRLQRDFDKFSNKNFCNSLNELFPKSMIDVIIKYCDIKGDTKCNQITKEQRLNFAKLIKCIKINVKDFNVIEEAIITSGGVNVKEINPKTMQSKIVDNLYFSGEVIDVDAYTGGFNLQIAFSTGYVAGFNSSEEIKYNGIYSN